MAAVRTSLIGLACVVVGIVADSLFLPRQSLWNDEVTQMCGLSLSPVEVTRWLAGRVDHDFGVDDDRMPPLSYWAGWAWSRAFGFGETPLRWFGVTCVAIATAIVFAAANRAWGLGSGVSAALLMATSPNVIGMSVEIRAYPALILMSSGLFACLVGYATGPIESRQKWLIGLLACGIGAMYLHFFGLVALGGALVVALVLAITRGEKPGPVILAGVVAGIAGLGLAPFVLASVGISPGGVAPTSRDKVMELARLVYRLFSHPSTSVSKAAVGLSALGFVLGIACGLTRKRQAGSASLGLFLALASGGLVVALVHLAQSLFIAALPHYNSWMIPALALLIASGLAASARAVRVASLASIVLLLAANTYGAGQLAFRGDSFAHTAYQPIGLLIQGYDPSKVAVIHDNDVKTSQAWSLYTPIHYSFGGKIRQYCYVPGERDPAKLQLADYPGEKTKVGLAGLLPFDDLIVIRSKINQATDLAEQIQTGIIPQGDGAVTQALLASGEWERVGESTYLALVGTDVDVFRKIKRI